ncbi:MAG: thiamine diphosphokinase [Solobacterium sp.]|nr:thiamine diphosphokinase [Solobacterium sp.]
MRPAVIILGNASVIPECSADYIGADRGALLAYEKGIRLKLAVGDFDSVSEAELEKIRSNSDETVVLNPVKDDTDSEAAIQRTLAKGYDQILICSDLSGRADHTIINLRLLMKYPGILSLQDVQNNAQAYTEGTYEIKKGDWKYFSVFAYDAVISLEGFRYPLKERHITQDDLYTVSNEILAEKGILTVHAGRVLVIKSRDINLI